MLEFVTLISSFFVSIFNIFSDTVIPFGGNFSGSSFTLAGLLFACLVIGFVVSIFWKGAKSQ